MIHELKEIYVCDNGWDLGSLMQDEYRVEDPVAVTPTLTVIDLEGSLYERLNNLYEVGRLGMINQLGIANCCSSLYRADSSRYMHSLIFATKIDNIAQTFGFDRNQAVIAAMLHDVRTPPLSDSVAIPMGLNDQEHLEKIFDSNLELDRIFADYSVSKKDIVRKIEGKDQSALGQLISSKDSIDVDRWSYTIWDRFRLGFEPDQSLGQTLDPFKTMKIVDEKIVYTDLKMVHDFLEKRTDSFERAYKNSELMAKEAFMGRITEDLMKKKLMDDESIFKMVDYEFENLVRRKCGDLGRRMFSMGGFQSYGATNADQREVEEYLGKLTNRPFAVKRQKPANPATGTPILIDDDVKPFSELEPKYSEKLGRRMSAWNHTNIYGYSEDIKFGEVAKKAIEHFSSIAKLDSK
ncbi:MAG: hypothetical protein V1850_06845 [Candidatus Bathyarchaeota archaeon]